MKKILAAMFAAVALTACGDAGEGAFQEIWDSGTEKQRGLICVIYLDDAITAGGDAMLDELMTAEMPDEIDRSDVKTVLDRECE